MKPVTLMIAGTANPHVPNYYRSLKSGSPIKLIAIADEDPRRLQYAKNFFSDSNTDIHFYKSWKKMFEKHKDTECVMVGSDNIHHFEITKDAILRGKHIYSMKVISMNEEECENLIKLRDQKGVLFQVEFELHFQPHFQNIKNMVMSGKLGNVKSIYFSNVSQSPCNYFPNWGNPKLSYGEKIRLKPHSKIFRGGALTDHPHPFDLIPWITGLKFKKIFAISGKNQRHYLEVEDHVAITGELEQGVKFFINPSYSNLEERVPKRILIWPKSLECNLKITGTCGYVATDFFDKHIYIVGKNYPSPNRLIVDSTRETTSFSHKGTSSALESFAYAVRGKRKIESTAEDGLYAVRIMNAVYQSIYTGKVVYI